MIQPPPQDRLAALRKWTLERDDESDPGGRIYRDPDGNCYHSITRILASTKSEASQKALARWLERPNSIQERDQAATRGSHAHSSAEYLLKTARKLAIHTANKRNLWKPGRDGLERAPSSITHWALNKASEGVPKVNWSAAGYARGLRHWITSGNVDAIHAIEFSVHHPAGFAGTADALLDLPGTCFGAPEKSHSRLCIVDWKTSQRARSEEMLEDYKCQAGAYAAGLRHCTGIQAEGAAIVVARRSGAPQVRFLDALELLDAEQRFLERCADYFLGLQLPQAAS